MTYVSIRHGGCLVGGLGLGNELNSLTLSSVGRGTTINHIEIIGSGDDEVEFFGGCVDVKYMSGFFGDDDKMDYDDGYHGRGQFLFSIAADSLNAGDLNSSDNGFEADADDQFGSTRANFPFQSNPQWYNATFISNGKVTATLDNTGHAGINAKEMAAGNFYNCILANFRSGVAFSEMRTTMTTNNNGVGDAYDQWTNNTGVPGVHIGTLPTVAGWNTDAAASVTVQPTPGAYPVAQALKIKNNVIIVPQDGKHYCFSRGSLIWGDQAAGGNPGVGSSAGMNGGANATDGKQTKNFTAPINGVGPSITNFGRTTLGFQNANVGLPNHLDSVQFMTTDGNQCLTSVPGISYSFLDVGTNSGSGSGSTAGQLFNSTNSGITTPFHVVPFTDIISSATPPADGFFTVVNYTGAFSAAEQNHSWLSDYGLMIVKSMSNSNPTDINQNGTTDVNDFLILLGKFGQLDK